MSGPEAEPGPTGAPPPGWYPDPDRPGEQQRYWDGTAWTDQRAPYAARPNRWLVGAGYVLSPIVVPSAMIAAALFARRDPHRWWVTALTLFFLALWIVAGILGGD